MDGKERKGRVLEEYVLGGNKKASEIKKESKVRQSYLGLISYIAYVGPEGCLSSFGERYDGAGGGAGPKKGKGGRFNRCGKG